MNGVSVFHNEHEIIRAIYDKFHLRMEDGHIPIDLRAPSLIGTVQDDPFDCFICEMITSEFPTLEVTSSGKLTTPDIIVRDRSSGVIVGIEVKKLIQQPNGADPRGLTMDYNSCLPCGTALIRVGDSTVDIPCYYLFCLLSNDSKQIVTLILMHGDFLNYDFNLHKEAKTANKSDYGHGPYGEGSVRRRAMYTYPNPLNYKLKCFFGRKIFVLKEPDSQRLKLTTWVTHRIERLDIYGNRFMYVIVENGQNSLSDSMVKDGVVPETVRDIFIACKKRKSKKRNSASMPRLDP